MRFCDDKPTGEKPTAFVVNIPPGTIFEGQIRGFESRWYKIKSKYNHTIVDLNSDELIHDFPVDEKVTKYHKLDACITITNK